MDKKVFIILLNYKGYEDTIEAVKSLEEIDYKNYEIIIVDNDSPDKSYELLKRDLGHKHHVIASGGNKGFAYGNNVGIKFALSHGADYVLLINNDTTVEKDFLTKLVNSAEKDTKAGITTGLILNYYNKEKIWFDGGVLNWKRFYGYHLNEGKNIKEVELKERYITFSTGCLMLIKKEVIENCGLLPEEYFMYYEDVDFCANVQEKGYKILYNPSSIIYHKISAASGEEESPFAIEWNTRNRIKFMKKYKYKLNNLEKTKFFSFFYLSRLIKMGKYMAKNRKDKSEALIKGLK